MNAQEKVELVEQAVKNYRGDISDLEKAIGMLYVGDFFGWRVLYLVHERRTLRKYEKILGINAKEIFAERGKYAHRSVGLAMADKLGNFWKLVKGEVPRDGVLMVQ